MNQARNISIFLSVIIILVIITIVHLSNVKTVIAFNELSTATNNSTRQWGPCESSYLNEENLPPPARNSTAKVLKALDARFDERREARMRAVKRMGSRRYDGKWAYDLFEPEANCLSEERFGSAERYEAFGDGPKFVCGVDVIASSDDGCLVYSVGSNNKFDFEVAVDTHLGCETHTFDPTVKRFNGGKYAEFHPWGLGTDGVNKTFRGGKYTEMSLLTMYKALGHEGRRINILKIDCEGCEWRAMPEIFSSISRGVLAVDQIQLEVHGTSFSEASALFSAADEAKMRVFHKERNHWGCDGYKCLEYAFVSESFLREANSYEISGKGNFSE